MVNRIKIQIERVQRQNTTDAIQIWKSVTAKTKLAELQKANNEVMLENESIARDIKSLSEKHKQLSDCALNFRLSKLQRCMNLTIRRFERHSMIKWYNYSVCMQQKEEAFEKLAKFETRHYSKLYVEKWKLKVKEQRRIQYICNFLENSERYKAISNKTKIFEAWDTFTQYQKRAKGNLKRVIIRCERHHEYKAFKKWKIFTHHDRLAKIKTHINELDNERKANIQEIEKINDQIEVTLSHNSHLTERLLTQARRIL